jgi:hypothetical protein
LDDELSQNRRIGKEFGFPKLGPLLEWKIDRFLDTLQFAYGANAKTNAFQYMLKNGFGRHKNEQRLEIYLLQRHWCC